MDLVREGFDVGIRASISASLPSSALIAKKLGPNSIALYASTQYAARRELPKHPHDLREHDNVVFFPNDAAEYHLKGPKGFTRIKVPGRVSGDDFFFIREAVLAGLGIGAMPTFMATQELAAGRLVRVLPEYQSALGAIYVMYPRRNRFRRRSPRSRRTSESRRRACFEREPARMRLDALGGAALRAGGAMTHLCADGRAKSCFH